MKLIKIIVEKHPEGYVAYPLELKGVVVGEGDTYEEALADVKSAIKFHIETFGKEAFETEEEELEATKEIIKDKDFLESIMKGDEDFKIGHFKKWSDNNWFINTNDYSLTTND